ncbi:MAG: EH signature domain-containing protein [Pseudanabaenaceae cyanobacterium]
MNLRLLSIPTSTPTELNQLTKHLPISAQQIPDIEKIINKIRNGESASLSAVDCFWCVIKKADWDLVKPQQEVIDSSRQLWLAATQHKPLRYWLLRGYLRSYLENQSFALSLKTTFENHFKNADLSEKPHPGILIDLLSLTPRYGISRLVSYSMQIFFAKDDILHFIQQSTGLLTVDLSQFTLQAAEVFVIQSQKISPQSSSTHINLGKWLVKCLNQEANIIDQQAKAVEVILTKIRKEESARYPQLVEWFKEHYQKGNRGQYLSENARRKLREWIGSVNFSDFAKLIRLVANSLPDYIGDKENRQKNQLLKRSYFWENYSDNFTQIRIFIPASTEKIVSSSFPNQYMVLRTDYSEPTEICVFDFDTHIIVEFFRGKSSEIRLFSCREDILIRHKLFENKSLSISDIRRLGGPVHDHVYFWQYYCERWLSKHGIYPNLNLTNFRIDEFRYSPYMRENGMEPPTDKQFEKRKVSRDKFIPPSP